VAGAGLVKPEKIAGQPHQLQHQQADRPGHQRTKYRPGLLDSFLAKVGLDLGNPKIEDR
jgi:hypothetical protein